MKKTRFLFLLGMIIVSTLSSSSRGGPEPPAAREGREANPPAAAAGQERPPRILRLTAGGYSVPTLNGLAIESGLVEPALGRQILYRPLFIR